MAYLVIGCRFLTGAIFAVSAAGKLRSPAAFRAFSAWLAGLPLLPVSVRPATAVTLPASEVACVILVAVPATAGGGLVLAAILLAVLAVGALISVRRDVTAPCACFGSSGARLSPRHVVRNAVLCLAATAGAVATVAGNPPAVRSAGVAAAVGGAGVAALLVLFLDDLAALAAGPGAAPGAATSPSAGNDTR